MYTGGFSKVIHWAPAMRKPLENVVWPSWDLLLFPVTLLPIAVMLTVPFWQRSICQVVRWISPTVWFPFFVASVFVADLDVYFMETQERGSLIDWQSTGPLRVCRTGKKYCVAPFSPSCFDLGAHGSLLCAVKDWTPYIYILLCKQRTQQASRIPPSRVSCRVRCQPDIECFPPWHEILSEGESVEDCLSSNCIIFQPHEQ